MNGCNVKNRTIFCDDNLDVLRGINSQCIDLIYLDPPFNKNKKFTAPIGSSAEGAEFSDIFREEDVKSEWLQTIGEDHPELFHYLNGIKGIGNHYNFAYLAYMAIRLIECHRVLKQTGSIYLHCDPTMSHYLKTLMDCVFEEKNFRNEIIWRRINSTGRAKKQLANNADYILYYIKESSSTWNQQYTAHDQAYVEKNYRLKDADGRRYSLGDLKGAGVTRGNSGKPWRGIDPSDSGSHWAIPHKAIPKSAINLTSQEKLDMLDSLGRIYWPRKGGMPRYKRYLDEMPGTAIDTIWVDINLVQAKSKERLDYPTQKPLALLERIIKQSSNEGDVVLDPFCGCATTCVAAEKLERQWIGVDISIKAYELVQKRLTKEVADPGDIIKFQNKIHLKTDPPKRTDLGIDYREQKYVYVISHPSYPGEYKVGIAKNWKSRLTAYQTSDPNRQYKLEFKLNTPHFRKLEKHIHEVFPNKHEWVHGDLKMIVKTIKQYKPENHK